MAKRKLRFEKLCESIITEKMAEILQKTNEDDCKSSDDELLSPDSLPHHSFSLFSPNCFSNPRSSNFHLSPLSSCLSNPNNTDDTPPENNLVHDEPFIAEALITEPPSSLSLPLLPVPNNQSSSSNNSASFGGSALENESLLSNTSLSFHAPALENDSLFSSVSFDNPALENESLPSNTLAFFDDPALENKSSPSNNSAAPALNNESSPSNSSASFYAEALKNESSLSNISVSFDAPALENESSLSNISVSFDAPALENESLPSNNSASPALENESSPSNSSASFYPQALENECLRSGSIISNHTTALVFSLNSKYSQPAWISSNESSSTFLSLLAPTSENNPSFRSSFLYEPSLNSESMPTLRESLSAQPPGIVSFSSLEERLPVLESANRAKSSSKVSNEAYVNSSALSPSTPLPNALQTQQSTTTSTDYSSPSFLLTLNKLSKRNQLKKNELWVSKLHYFCSSLSQHNIVEVTILHLRSFKTFLLFLCKKLNIHFLTAYIE